MTQDSQMGKCPNPSSFLSSSLVQKIRLGLIAMKYDTLNLIRKVTPKGIVIFLIESLTFFFCGVYLLTVKREVSYSNFMSKYSKRGSFLTVKSCCKDELHGYGTNWFCVHIFLWFSQKWDQAPQDPQTHVRVEFLVGYKG